MHHSAGGVKGRVAPGQAQLRRARAGCGGLGGGGHAGLWLENTDVEALTDVYETDASSCVERSLDSICWSS